MKFRKIKRNLEKNKTDFIGLKGGVVRCQVLYNVDSLEPKTVHLLHLNFINVDRSVCLCLLVSKINNFHC